MRVVAIQILAACLAGALGLMWIGYTFHRVVGNANPPWNAGFRLVLVLVTPVLIAMAVTGIWLDSYARKRAEPPVRYRSAAPVITIAVAISLAGDWLYLVIASRG
jgi:hypothetical protein